MKGATAAARVAGNRATAAALGRCQRNGRYRASFGSKNWPWSNTRACVAHLATQGTGLRRGAPCAAAAATLGWRMSPARNAQTPKACYGPKQRAQRIEGWLLVLTGVQGCRGSRAEGATARTGGGISAWWSRVGRCGDLRLLVTSIRRVVKL